MNQSWLSIQRCTFNARSLVNELALFQSFVCSSAYKIIGVTEFWLTNSTYSSEVLPNGCRILYNDQGTGRWYYGRTGRIGTCSVFAFTWRTRSSYHSNMLQSSWYYMCALYMAPDSVLSYFQFLLLYLSRILFFMAILISLTSVGPLCLHSLINLIYFVNLFLLSCGTRSSSCTCQRKYSRSCAH